LMELIAFFKKLLKKETSYVPTARQMLVIITRIKARVNGKILATTTIYGGMRTSYPSARK